MVRVVGVDQTHPKPKLYSHNAGSLRDPGITVEQKEDESRNTVAGKVNAAQS